jgi:hypothetical protein
MYYFTNKATLMSLFLRMRSMISQKNSG